MKKNNNAGINLYNKGMTLVELIIVLALISIIGAILVPNLLSTTDKARLKSDIQSARVIQNAIQLYNAEQDKPVNTSSMANILSELNGKGYINSKTVSTQCDKAVWVYKPDGGENFILVDVGGCTENIKKNAYGKLTEQEKKQVINGIATSVTTDDENDD